MSQWQGRQWLAVTLYSLVMCQVRACADLVVLNAAVGACGKETKRNFWSYIHVMEVHRSTGLCILAAAVQGQPVVTGAAVDAGPRTWRNQKKAGFGNCVPARMPYISPPILSPGTQCLGRGQKVPSGNVPSTYLKLCCFGTMQCASVSHVAPT